MLPNLGFAEVFLITAVALLFFGPERIPEAAKGLGRAFKSFKEGLRETTQEIEKTTQDTEK